MNLVQKNKMNVVLSMLLAFAVILSTFSIPVNAQTYPAWTAGTSYVAGDIVSYDGNNYQCLQPHAALGGWEPSTTPALWSYHSPAGPAPETVATPSFSPDGGVYSGTQSVAIACTTAGAQIRYTVDGSDPTSASALYTAPVTVSSSTTLKAIGLKEDMLTSAVATAAYTIVSDTETAEPVFSINGGTYYAPQSVSISCITAGAEIRYTTDGTAPTLSSPLYTGPVGITETTTLKAQAFKSGLTDSAVVTAVYVITVREAGQKRLIGYWHNFDNNLTPIMKLRDISPAWDVIDVAFADIAPDATVSFTPFNATEDEFKADVTYLLGQGKEVVLSLGGQNGALNLQDASSTERFIESLIATIDQFGFSGIDVDIETGISLGANDADFRNPQSPAIVNLIQALKEVCAHYGPDFVLTMAPEVAYVQGGITAYGGPWGAYLPIIHAMRDELDCLHVQHYNCGGNAAPDGRTYNQGTADFQVAMIEMLLQGFPIAGNPNNMFPPLDPCQVAPGIPAAVGAAPSGGYIPPAEMKKALDYLINGVSFGGTYQLQNPSGYPELAGLMTWSINWDVQNNYEFSTQYDPFLDAMN
jgi:chitinase